MIITGGSSMKRGGFLQKTEQVLKDNGMEAVSYTHLDVYKRQPLGAPDEEAGH